jgi:hypothetical protein
VRSGGSNPKLAALVQMLRQHFLVRPLPALLHLLFLLPMFVLLVGVG